MRLLSWLGLTIETTTRLGLGFMVTIEAKTRTRIKTKGAGERHYRPKVEEVEGYLASEVSWK